MWHCVCDVDYMSELYGLTLIIIVISMWYIDNLMYDLRLREYVWLCLWELVYAW